MSRNEVFQKIDGYRQDVIDLQRELVAIPALSPTYGAPAEQTGEARKVQFLADYLTRHGFADLRRIESPDPTVPGGIRPTLVARVPGRSSQRTVWVMAHTDVVPPGDLSKWEGDPWTLRVEGDRLIGRGVEDNHQGLVAGVMAARALIDSGVTPAWDLALLLVADEECGSEYGIQYVLDHDNPFTAEDLIIVPDGGAVDGSEIEVAEKSIAWIRFEVRGVQCHASMPGKGNNAMRAGAHLVVALDELHRVFDASDPVYEPPISTFEPTMKEANVPNVNTIPGEDVFCLDCRVLPTYALEAVEAKVVEICRGVEERFGVAVSHRYLQREEAAPPTPTDAPVVARLAAAVKEVYGVEARPVGIGGGTVAAYLRRKGLPCVVWSKMEETMHGPNESALIPNILGDAKVIARVALGDE